MSDTVDLGEFEGRKVTKTTIAVRNAGDGLSKAMKVDPQLLHQGDRVYVVLECDVDKVTFDPYDDGVCARIQNLNAGTATIIDGAVVRDALDQQRDRIKLHEDAQKGVHELPTSEALAREHTAGLHDGDDPDVHPACPSCNPDTFADGDDDGDGE